MKDIYILLYNGESMIEIVDNPTSIIRSLIESGYSYDEMRLFKGKEIDFTVDLTNADIKVKEE